MLYIVIYKSKNKEWSNILTTKNIDTWTLNIEKKKKILYGMNNCQFLKQLLVFILFYFFFKKYQKNMIYAGQRSS